MNKGTQEFFAFGFGKGKARQGNQAKKAKAKGKEFLSTYNNQTNGTLTLLVHLL